MDSTLKEKLQADLKQALKDKNETAVGSLRFLMAALKNEEISKREPLTDEEIHKIIRRQIKKHQESIASYTTGNRPELVAKEQAEMAILAVYLPPEVSPEVIRAEAEKVIAELSATSKDFGRVMGLLVKRLGPTAPGQVVSQAVRELLSTK